jgi:phenylacetate-CoA ligase
MPLRTIFSPDFPRRLGYHAYQLRRLARPTTRHAWDVYRHGLRTRRQNLGLSGEERDRWILEELRRTVRRAAELPFWRERFVQAGFSWDDSFSFADYSSVPPLERAEIAAAGDGLLRPEVPAAQRRKMATGGSSGAPTVTWTGPEEQGWGESAAEHFERRIGVRHGDRIAYLWGHHLDPVTRASRRERLEDWLFNRRWFDCFRLSPEVLAGYHAELQEYRPRVMICYASALASLAETIRDAGLAKPVYPVFGFLTGAEKLYPAQRALIESVFGKPVYERYGGRDIGMIGCQLALPESLAYDVDWSNVYVERETPAEESSMLITKLHADAMPLLRYRTGDIGRFPEGSPTHGPITVLHEVTGREIQRIWRADGTWMHGTVVPHLLKDFALHEYQLHQRESYETELLLVPRAGFDAAQEAEIRRALEMNLPGIPFHIRHVEAIPRSTAGKWLPVLSDVRR